MNVLCPADRTALMKCVSECLKQILHVFVYGKKRIHDSSLFENVVHLTWTSICAFYRFYFTSDKAGKF